MAPTSHGRIAPQGREAPTNGTNTNAPPPSTLAAQLVENISVPTRSSRSDEAAELPKLLGIIEKVKNEPDSLKSQGERVEHNHMLIYVYTRVSLESLKWDDPFADRELLRMDALRAINFLKFAIRETPEVLLSTSEQGSLLFRGIEPLWTWLFPKVLKMLGFGLCLELTPTIEEFFDEVFLSSCRTAVLWPLVPQFLLYFRLSFLGESSTHAIWYWPPNSYTLSCMWPSKRTSSSIYEPRYRSSAETTS
jgi:serine/threonine-protein kinase ATR